MAKKKAVKKTAKKTKTSKQQAVKSVNNVVKESYLKIMFTGDEVVVGGENVSGAHFKKAITALEIMIAEILTKGPESLEDNRI